MMMCIDEDEHNTLLSLTSSLACQFPNLSLAALLNPVITLLEEKVFQPSAKVSVFCFMQPSGSTTSPCFSNSSRINQQLTIAIAQTGPLAPASQSALFTNFHKLHLLICPESLLSLELKHTNVIIALATQKPEAHP